MNISVSGGWTEGEARNELDFKVSAVGADAQEVAHLQSLLADDWSIENVAFSAGTLTFDVKAARKVTLAAQAEAKAAADRVAADKAAADAKVASDAAAEQAKKDARVAGIAAAASKAAVEAVLAAEAPGLKAAVK
jgi:hypothetical protein